MSGMPDRRILCLFALATGFAVACKSVDGGPADVWTDSASDVPPTDTAMDPAPELPPLLASCGACHDLEELKEVASDESAGPRQWMAFQGNGLVRVEPALPAPGTQYGLKWIDRGRHDDPMGDCATCHPVRDDGTGHGLRIYPQVDGVFEGGTDCAGGCHTWLKDTVEVPGFENSEGVTPVYAGSARPGDLLEGANTAHSKLWREGARPDAALFRIAAFNPGCGGCHNLAAESHGTTMGCLDCHKFLGGPHDLHVQVVNALMDQVDPGAGAAGLALCAYCHVHDDPSMVRSGSVCYNCHLSGHQPLDGQGKAHFWQ